MWLLWWVWMAAAIVMVILEVMVPGYIFLGFAIGAATVGVLLLVATPTLPWLLVIFAVVSLVAWIAMRRFFAASGGGQVKTFDHDINDN